MPADTPRVLIVIENTPVQRDIRVQREARALLAAGYGVSVVCPRDEATPLPEDLRAVRVHAYPPPKEGASTLAFVWEYAYSLVAIAVMVVRALRHEGFDAIQVCNPPDMLFLIAAPLRLLGKRFVFDHHDPAPEMFRMRFGDRAQPIHRVLLLLERLTFATADHIVSTNDSMRQIALGRGRQWPRDVTVVRNGPELARMSHPEPDPHLRAGRELMCCWLGNMGPDDGVDLALEAVAQVIHEHDRQNCQFVFLGDGEARPDLERRAESLGIAPWVSFPGWVTHDVMHRYLASAHVALVPDPKNARSDISTMIKVMDYMAFALPMVAFDVNETRVSAGPAALCAAPGDIGGYADLIERLLRAPDERQRLGQVGRQRVEQALAWEHQRDAYVDVFASLKP